LKTEKLELRFEKGHFMGYPKESLGCYAYFLADPRVVVTRHIIILEEAFIQEGWYGQENRFGIRRVLCSINA